MTETQGICKLMFHFALPTCYAEKGLIHIAPVPEKNSKPPYRKSKNTVKFVIQPGVSLLFHLFLSLTNCNLNNAKFFKCKII